MQILIDCFGKIITFFYNLTNNYAISLTLFTLVAKIVLFPVNILTQKNSIKMIKMRPLLDELKIKYQNDKDSFMEAQIDLFEKEKYRPSLGVVPLLIQIPIILALINVINNVDKYIPNIKNVYLFNINLCAKSTFLVLVLTAFSTLLLCYFQNIWNVLQKEESPLSKAFTTILTTGLTLYFVHYVPGGVAYYWFLGDLFAILQTYILNLMFPPSKYVDYEYFNRIEKQKVEERKRKKIENKLSKKYYKEFFKPENVDNMHLVFFSESSGYYKYFKGIIEYILNNSNITIYYITNDMNDKIFENKTSRIIPYYINTNQLISLFMKLECDMMVMTTPDLQNYYLKRSMVKKDIEYIYTFHGLSSVNLTLNVGAIDNYDTIFSIGDPWTEEIKELEKLRNTKEKNIVKAGFPLYDDLYANYKEDLTSKEKTILIAPSWQDKNIIDLCLDELIDALSITNYKIILRPHPQYVKLYKDKLEIVENKYKDLKNFVLQKDFSSNSTVYNADILITDWSSIAYEYSCITLKPSIFINTPMKIMNKDYKKLNIIPIDLEMRDKIGKTVDMDKISELSDVIKDIEINKDEYKNNILDSRDKYLYNFGHASEVAGKYIVNKLNNVKGE